MKNKHIDTIVINLVKKKRKICYVDELKSCIREELKETYTEQKAYKVLYYLKRRGYVHALKKDIYYISTPQDEFDENDIVNRWYRDILYMHCSSSCWKKRYLGGQKALELYLQNYEVPESILIVNTAKQAQETVMRGKTVLFKQYTVKSKQFFSTFSAYTQKMKLGKYKFPVASFEIALLESLYNSNPRSDIVLYEQIKKTLKKTKQLDMKVISQILKTGKHHTSCNRLYKLLKPLQPKLAEQLQWIIKQRSFFLET